MTPSQAIGYSLTQATAVTAIASAGSISFGLRPAGGVTPCINYFELPGGVRQYGIERVTYSINCRAATAETAMNLARKVVDVFHGTSGAGVYGTQSSFSVVRASLRQSQGLIPETQDNLYNCPVDILLVYPSGTVS